MAAIVLPKIDTELSSESIFNAFKTNIETWLKRVESLRQEKEREKSPDVKDELFELDQLTAFLKGRMTKRLLGIKQFPEELRKQYLRCIEPFYTEEGITRFMTHYFEVEVFKQVRLRFRKKKDFEKEVNVLFDLYRVKKTIETITTLEKSVQSNEPFVSRFEKSEQAEFLKTLREIFKLFFLRFVKKEYRKELYDALSESNLDMDSIIAMRKSGTSYINQEVFKTNEYREKFITVFFSTLLRTKTSSEIKDLHFNYLNFELLKNEFLTDWIQRKLKTSPEKDKVLQNYQIEGKSLAQIIKENPEKEKEILSNLPLDLFNDIAEQVNEKVKDENKTPVTTFSKKHGLFARLEESFQAVKQIAKYSVEKMEEMKPKTKIWTVKKKVEKGVKQSLPIKKAEEKTTPPKPQPKKELKIQYGLEVLKMDDLDFPFFDKRVETYRPKLEFLVKKVGTDYEKFRSKMWKLFNLVAKEHFIIRKDPCHEWVIPLLISSGKLQFLLILGAEISLKDQQAGYQSKFAKSVHALNCFYLLGTQNRNEKFGKVTDIRTVKNAPFHLYSYVEQTVQNMSFTLLTRLFQTKDAKVFKSSNLNLRKQGTPFPELDELKVLLGLEEKKEVSDSQESGQASQSPQTVGEHSAQEPATVSKSPRTIAEDNASQSTDINEVAKNVKMEIEEEKKHPKPVKPKKETAGVSDIKDVAAKVKQEMEEEKKHPKPVEPGKATTKVQDIKEIAAQVKKEMSEEKARQTSASSNQEEQASPQKVESISKVANELEEELKSG